MLNHILNTIPLINRWRVLVLSVAVFVITSLLLIALLPIHDGLNLLLFFACMTVSCTSIPLPTPLMVVSRGQEFDPLLIALVGGIGTCIACLIDYEVLSYLVKYVSNKSENVARLKDTRVCQFTVRFFNKMAFISIVIAGATPIPFEPIRWLAIGVKYSRLKYTLAVFIGRAPRYYLLAWIGDQLIELNLLQFEGNLNKILFGIIFLTITIVFIKKIVKSIRKPAK